MRVPVRQPNTVSPLLGTLGLIAGAIALGLGAGALVAQVNPVIPLAVVAGLLPLPWLLTRPLLNLLAAIAIILLLPFATLPVKIGATPTFLEIVLLAGLGVWAFYLARRPETGLVRSPLDIPMLVLVGVSAFALLLGLGRDFGLDILHNYFKTLLGITIFFSALQIIRTPDQMQWVMRALVGGGALAAAGGVVLWRLPDTPAARLLGALRVVGYPTDRIIRYVEDDPARGERATSTSVDPNSFGALLAVIIALTLAQAVARRPVFPRPLLWAALAVEGVALYATQSRTALLAALAAAGLIALLRYRRLLVLGGITGGVVLATGAGGAYLARLQSGLAFQDQAQLMRLAEYRNALAIIERYPFFGVGFGRAGELDLTTGVSSIYLTIAERMGLIGLAVFLLTLAFFFALTLPALFRRRPVVSGQWSVVSGQSQVGSGQRAASDEYATRNTQHATRTTQHPPNPQSAIRNPQSAVLVYDPVLLGATAAVAAALVEGVADHPFFNIEYSHMVALFWLCVALGLIARQGLLVPGREQEGNDGSSGVL